MLYAQPMQQFAKPSVLARHLLRRGLDFSHRIDFMVA